jgi:hypothetical protein
VTAFATAGLGFLLAVLWFDLMFDVQAARQRADADLPEGVRASISAYYARVTTAARPMNRLIALVMVATIAALVVELLQDDVPDWVAAASLALTLLAVGLAGARTVPDARRLGARRDDAGVQSALARSILRDHLICLAAIGSVLVLQLSSAP